MMKGKNLLYVSLEWVDTPAFFDASVEFTTSVYDISSGEMMPVIDNSVVPIHKTGSVVFNAHFTCCECSRRIYSWNAACPTVFAIAQCVAQNFAITIVEHEISLGDSEPSGLNHPTAVHG